MYVFFEIYSGSGKTTLLNVLNFRSSSNLQVKGEIMINGTVTNAEKMSIISCYIQQDDLFFGTLTVKEHLEFHVCQIL
jgi:ABC-type multidrug transport system ATPase subunit